MSENLLSQLPREVLGLITSRLPMTFLARLCMTSVSVERAVLETIDIFSMDLLDLSELKDVAEIAYFVKRFPSLQRLSFQFSPIRSSTKVVLDIIEKSSTQLRELVLAPDPRLSAASRASSLQYAMPQFAPDFLGSIQSKNLSFPTLKTLYLSCETVAVLDQHTLRLWLSMISESMPVLENLYLQWNVVESARQTNEKMLSAHDFVKFKKLKHLCLSEPLLSFPDGENIDIDIIRHQLVEFKSGLCPSLQQTMSIFYLDSQLKLPLLYRLVALGYNKIRPEVLDLALSVGFDINSYQPLFGTIPLLAIFICCAVQDPNRYSEGDLVPDLASVKALIERGADPIVRDSEGNNAFLLTAIASPKDGLLWDYMFDQVLRNVASNLSASQKSSLLINNQDNRSLWDFVLRRPDPETFGNRVLDLSNSFAFIDPNHRSDDGSTPFWEAMGDIDNDFLKRLIDAGMDPTVPDAEGLTIIDFACTNTLSRSWIVENILTQPTFKWTEQLVQSPACVTLLNAINNIELFDSLWTFVVTQEDVEKRKRLLSIMLRNLCIAFSKRPIVWQDDGDGEDDSAAFPKPEIPLLEKIDEALRLGADPTMMFPKRAGSVSALEPLLITDIEGNTGAYDLIIRLLDLGADPFAPCLIQSHYYGYYGNREAYLCSNLSIYLRNERYSTLLQRILRPYTEMREADVPGRVVAACTDMIIASRHFESVQDPEVTLTPLRSIAKLCRLHIDSRHPLMHTTRRMLLDTNLSATFISMVFEMTPLQFAQRFLFGISGAELSETFWSKASRQTTVMQAFISSYFLGYLAEPEMLQALKLMVSAGGNPFKPAQSAIASMTIPDTIATFLSSTQYLVDAFEILLSAVVPGHEAAQEMKRSVLGDALITIVSMGAANTELDIHSGLEADTRESEAYLLDLIKKLVSAGADITVRTPENSTLLHLAACRLSAAKLKLLLSYPELAALKEKQNFVGHTAFDDLKHRCTRQKLFEELTSILL